MALTERERQLVDAFRWISTCVHEAHHNPAVPPQHRRTVDTCGSKICAYATKIIEGAEREDRNGED